jgi:hypothetical protein
MWHIPSASLWRLWGMVMATKRRMETAAMAESKMRSEEEIVLLILHFSQCLGKTQPVSQSSCI